MKNFEKYTTPQERIRGFNKYCSLRHSCENCKLDNPERHDLETSVNALDCSCAIYWLELEAEEVTNEETDKEAKDEDNND